MKRKGVTMRLIDADALTADLDKGLWGREWDKSLAEAIIKDAPTIDAVEVVRCKDCKFYQPFDPHRKYDCNRGLLGVMGDDYCSYGERKE